MADKLTPQQYMAVTDRGGDLLVSAAAGSGKTKVLVDRILSYLTDPNDPADLDDFLIITYTKAAASELRAKIAAKLSERIAQEPENRHLQKQMQRLFLTTISTVHGFCGDLLREYAYKLDLAADFRIADEVECREIRDGVMKDLLDRAYENRQASPDFMAFVDSQGLGRSDASVPELIEKVYDSARCHLDPQAWLDSCVSSLETDTVSDVSEMLWGKYLIADLFRYLDHQITALKSCLEALNAAEGMEKPAENIRATVCRLEEIRNCATWDGISKLRGMDYGRLTFPKKESNSDLALGVKAVRNACKASLAKKLAVFSDESAQILEDMEQILAGTRGLVELVRQFDRDYQAAKRGRRCLDFGDLEHKTLDLLLGKLRGSPTVAAREIGSRYREIMVDEYQDSNGVQDEIFRVLTREKHNAFMVGDVKQSIYQFRLADPGIFLQKYNTFLPAGEAKCGEGRKVLLSHNFRSGPEVIEGVNAVFSSCMTPEVGGLYYGEEEALREGVSHEKLADRGTELYCLNVQESTYDEESDFVAEKISGMLKNKTLIRKKDGFAPVTPDDIVILLRSPGSVGHHYRRALEKKGIRCSTGGGTNLLLTEEVATLRSFLQIIINPRQDIPLISALASPLFGFTADDLAALRSGNRGGYIYDALLEADSPKVHYFLDVLTQLRDSARMNTLTQLLEECFSLTRLDSIYGIMEGGESKQRNLQAFYQLAAGFEAGTLRDLGQFLEHLDSLEKKGLVTAEAASGGCVTIMSIHKSKGLEFPVVFLCALSRGFNKESLRGQVLCDKELGLGLLVADKKTRVRYPSLARRAIAAKMQEESLSEEMRVLYVAMTRAKDRLIMVYSSDKLSDTLEDIVLRLSYHGKEILCREADNPGRWILMTALKRLEAGQLHSLGGKPDNCAISDYPWQISVAEGSAQDGGFIRGEDQTRSMPNGAEEILAKALSFRYPHQEATKAPSKQTATGRKGRVKDSETAEDTPVPRQVNRGWRKPSFLEAKIDGLRYGTAIHAAMQYVRYENCGSPEAVRQEICRLKEEKYLSGECAALVDCEAIARFFATEIGQKLRSGANCVREFKFSLLDDASDYGDALEGEQVLLQGVVDCAILEPDGITVVDFKTDYVTESTLTAKVEQYKPQVETYAEALSRIFEEPIKRKVLYFFHLDHFADI